MKNSRRVFLQKIMQGAWTLARAGVKKFGGSSREYFAISLQMVWMQAKAEAMRNARTRPQYLPGFTRIPVQIGQALLPGFVAK